MPTYFILTRILSHSTSQKSTRFSFSKREFGGKKKIRLAQCNSLVLLIIALFQRRQLYRLSHQWVYRFAFSLFPHLSTMYMTSFLLIPWFICVSDKGLCSLLNALPSWLVMQWRGAGETKTPNQADLVL